MNAASFVTPPMSAARAETIARSFDLRSLPADFYANPYPVYAWLQQHEPVRRMPDGSFFLTRHADLTAVYRDAQTFSSDKQVEFGAKYGAGSHLFAHHTTSLVFNDPPLHSHVRKLMMGALTRRAIAAMEPSLTRLVDSLLDKIEERGGGDLIADFASAIPIEVIGNLLGVPHDEREPLREWSLAILGALEPSLTPEQEARGNESVREFEAYLKTLIERRRQNPGDPEHDVLTRLIQGDLAQTRPADSATMGSGSHPALSEQELLQNCIFILNAGHETTTNLIGNALAALQDWPQAKNQLLSKAELLTSDSPGLEAYLICAVDEFLRFESSNQLGNRRAVVATRVGDQDVPAGSLITLCIAAANRDPAQFADPDQLDIERAENRHLAFGLGIHQCAGLSLARLEGRIAIGRFLQRFPNYRLTETPVRPRRARFRGFSAAPFDCQ
jgi:cytochrome P450